MPILKSSACTHLYKFHQWKPSPTSVVDFLLFDWYFPRSIHYCLSKAQQSLHNISGTPTGVSSNAAERRLGQLVADLNYTDVQEVIQDGLHEFLDNFQEKLNMVGACIFDTFFALRPVHQTTPLNQGQ